MEYRIRIRRYDPARRPPAYWQEYRVEADPRDRVLDALHQIRAQDPTLAFRRSCGHGICGSDAMKIQGKNRLACKTLLRELPRRFTVEPLPGYRVLRDLVVDMEGFFRKYREIAPYLIPESSAPATERLQTPEELQAISDTTKCILCGACTSSCPSFWAREEYIGPAMIVQAHRFLFDSRDSATRERLQKLAESMGIWRCRFAFNCLEACPREINIPRAIAEVKQALLRELF